MTAFLYKDDCVIVDIKVVPNSSKNEIIKDGERIRVKITAPPVDNKANKFIIEYFSKQLRIPKSNIKIIKGELSREKTVKFIEISPDKKKLIDELFGQ